MKKLLIALVLSGCATLGLPQSVLDARNFFCKEESCPAQEDVHQGWFEKSAIYDEGNDECVCVMINADGHERAFHVPRRAPADAPLRRAE